MKKFLTIFAGLCLVVFPAFAQDVTDTQKAAADAAAAISKAPQAAVPVQKPQYWTKTLLTKLDFGQTSLTNWAAGGYNTVSLKSFLDGNANYKKDAMFWNNRLQLDYGFIYSADKPFIQKSDDRIYLESKWGYQAAKNLNYSAQFSYKSQFSNSYEYPVPTGYTGTEPTRSDWMAARILKSGLTSPAYTNLALGIDWVPNKWLTVNMAPLTGGFVIVSDYQLRKNYGMKLRKPYEGTTDVNNGHLYHPAKFEFGAQMKVDGKMQVNDNFNYTTQLVLFSDYLDHPENLRVNWDNRFDWKVAKYFSFTVITNLIYDDKVLVKTENDAVGHKRVQFRESLGLGFSYTFASKR